MLHQDQLFCFLYEKYFFQQILEYLKIDLQIIFDRNLSVHFHLVLFGDGNIKIFTEFQKVALYQSMMYFVNLVKSRADVGSRLVLLAVEPKNLFQILDLLSRNSL